MGKKRHHDEEAIEAEASVKKQRFEEISNVDLIKHIRTASTPLSKKLELAAEYVELQTNGVVSKGTSLPMPQFVSYILEWIQSQIIQSTKPKASVSKKKKNSKAETGVVDDVIAHMDVRAWRVLHWSLVSSSSQRGAHISPGIFKGVDAVLSALVKSVEDGSGNLKFEGELLERMEEVLQLLFHSCERYFRPNLNDWSSVLLSTLKMITIGDLVHKIATLVCDGFGKFLMSYPNPKAAFQEIVDKLLEPLLTSLGTITSLPHTDATQRLQIALGKIIENGLFHPAHVENLSDEAALGCWTADGEFELQAADAPHASYHRAFFRKLIVLRDGHNHTALSVLGDVFRMFARMYKTRRAALAEDVFGVRGSGYIQSIETEHSNQQKSDSEAKRKHLSDNQRLFIVFAEFTLPLMESLQKSEPKNILQCNALVSGANGLFAAARDEQVYVATKDLPSQGHLKFIKKFHNVLFDYARLICSTAVDTDNSVAAAGLREVVLGLTYVVEVEHRASEDHIEEFWLLVLTAVALQPVAAREEAVAEAVRLSCQILNIFSDLRNVGQPFSILFSSMQCFVKAQAGVSEEDSSFLLHSAEYGAAIASLFCAKDFLKVVGSVMQVLPEGQVAEFCKKVAASASETLDLLSSDQIYGHEKQMEYAFKALVELFSTIMENLNLTSTNSLQVGIHVRSFVDTVISAPLSEVLEDLTKKKKKKKRKVNEGFSMKLYLLLRLFSACKMVHGQCVTLMPPKKATEAVIAAQEIPSDASLADWLEIAVTSKEGYFTWVGRSTVTISDILTSVEYLGIGSPWLEYALDGLIIQRLADIDRCIHAAEYFILMIASSDDSSAAAADPIMHASSDEAVLGGLISKLKLEASSLTEVLVSNVDVNSEEDWDEVAATITSEKIEPAKWLLLCRTIDLWSKHASKSMMRLFLRKVLSSWERLIISNKGGEVCIATTTSELLKDTSFYEVKGFVEALPVVWCKLLSEALQLDIKYKESVKNEEWFVVDDVKKTIKRKVSLQELEKTTNLLDFLSSLPSEHAMDHNVRYVWFIFHIEKLILKQLEQECKKSNAAMTYVSKLLEVFYMCRSALDSLTVHRKISPLATLFSDKLSKWFFYSLDAALHCLSTMNAIDTAADVQKLLNASHSFLMKMSTEIFVQGSKTLMKEYSSAGATNLQIEENDSVRSFIEVCTNESGSLGDDVLAVGGVHKLRLISSLLWSMAMALEGVNRDCYQKKESQLKWSTALPTSWVTCLRQLEPVTVALFRKFLLPASMVTATSDHSITGIFWEYEKIEMLDGDEVLNDVEGNENEVWDEVSSDREENANAGNERDDEVLSEGEEKDDEVLSDADEEEEEEEDEKNIPEVEDDTSDDVASTILGFSGLQQNLLLENISKRVKEQQQSELVGEIFMAMAALVQIRSLYFSPYAIKARQKEYSLPSPVNELIVAAFCVSREFISSSAEGNLKWMRGIIKCLESSGNLVASLKPPLSSADYSKLVKVHIDLLSCLQKEYSLMLRNAVNLSFGALIRHAPRHHLTIAMHSLERTICGIKGSEYLLNIGSIDNGTVDTTVAAGVELLATTLDAISGRWRLQVLAKKCSSFVGALFNLIVKLEGSSLFFEKISQTSSSSSSSSCTSESVVLQSLEIITRVASREKIFPMKATHVAMALHCAAGIFKPFYQFRMSARTIARNFSPSTSLLQLPSPSVISKSGEVAVKVFVGCCKLLCAVLRHRKRESGRSISLLGESCRVLLFSLEGAEGSSKGLGLWSIENGAECGQWLRRVYEELGEHKDSLGRYCCHILSDYLSVLSGNGPSAVGLERKVDKEVRSGVYALMNACSASDLQQVHAAVGEGPMRNNLNNVRREYENDFKYKGKV